MAKAVDRTDKDHNTAQTKSLRCAIGLKRRISSINLTSEMETTMTDLPHKVPTTIGGYALAIAKALDYRGIESLEILRKAGIERTLRNDPLDRLPFTTITKLYELSVEATGDPYFGLTVARFMRAANLHAFGYSLLSSSTLLDFCQRLARYFRLASQVAYYYTEEHDNEIRLGGHILVDICDETQDAFQGFVVHFMRMLYKPDFAPLRVELNRPEPRLGPGPFIDFFNAPVSFGHDEISLYFNRDDMVVPLMAASPELAQFNDNIIVDYLARLERSDIVAQVESKLIECMPSGHITKEKIAKQLNMSPSTLKLKLSQQDTSFQQLLDQARQNLSRSYMEQSDISISEIAYLLGFTDTSSFSRAFKRWTGQSPSQYRLAQQKP